MSSRVLRVGVAEAKARFAEVVSRATEQRTIIQRRGQDVAVVIGIDELRRLDEAHRGKTAGALLLERLERVKASAGVPLDLPRARFDFVQRDPFDAPRTRRRK